MTRGRRIALWVAGSIAGLLVLRTATVPTLAGVRRVMFDAPAPGEPTR